MLGFTRSSDTSVPIRHTYSVEVATSEVRDSVVSASQVVFLQPSGNVGQSTMLISAETTAARDSNANPKTNIEDGAMAARL